MQNLGDLSCTSKQAHSHTTIKLRVHFPEFTEGIWKAEAGGGSKLDTVSLMPFKDSVPPWDFSTFTSSFS